MGIGTALTEKFLPEAIRNGSRYCLLRASLVGESIYKKLGFSGFGELEIYKILKNKANTVFSALKRSLYEMPWESRLLNENI
jgi:hypothetical protein